MIPEKYMLTDRGFQKVIDPVEDWWLALGKLHLGYGVRAMKKAMAQEVSPKEKDALLDKAIRHYAQAVAYFQQYSPEAHELSITLRSIHRRLKTVRTDRLERLRAQIDRFAEEHKVDLGRLIRQLDATIGLPPLEKS